MIAKHQALKLSMALLAACLATAAAADQAVSPAHSGTLAPHLKDHALVVPYYLPHLMEFAGEAGLSEQEMQTLKAYADERIRPVLPPIFQQARTLEAEIGLAALEGRTVEQLAPQIDRLAALKREAAELHIECVNTVRDHLPADKYQRLIELATAARVQ